VRAEVGRLRLPRRRRDRPGRRAPRQLKTTRASRAVGWEARSSCDGTCPRFEVAVDVVDGGRAISRSLKRHAPFDTLEDVLVLGGRDDLDGGQGTWLQGACCRAGARPPGRALVDIDGSCRVTKVRVRGVPVRVEVIPAAVQSPRPPSRDAAVGAPVPSANRSMACANSSLRTSERPPSTASA